MCKKEINRDDKNWFCSKKCENEWNLLNGELRIEEKGKVKGRDTSG